MQKYTQTASFKINVILASIVISMFLCDWTLILLNYPLEVSQRISHPANYTEHRDNIEFKYDFKTNNQGLRYRNISTEKPPNTHRVFVSGDSFTEGVGVDDGKRFTDLLEDKFKSSNTEIQFINGGLASTGPLEYGRLFLKIGLEYNPDALLVCIFVNDVANTPETLPPKFFSAPPSQFNLKTIAHTLWPRLYTLIKNIYQQSEHSRKTRTTDFIKTVSRQARKEGIPQLQINKWKESLPQELVRAVNQGKFNGSILSYGLLYPEYWSDSIDILGGRAEKKWRNMTIILTELLKLANESKVSPAVILIPTAFHYDPNSHSKTNPWIIAGSKIKKEWLSQETNIQKRMKLWAFSENVPFLDLTPVFRKAIKSNKSSNWKLDGHWNHHGHEAAANAISSWLIDQHIFPFMRRED